MPKTDKRRDDGDGTFRTLPNGTLEYTVSYGYDAYGKRQRKRFYGKNASDCRRKAKDFLRNVGTEKAAIIDYTLGQWLDRWLQSYYGKRIQAGQKQIQQSTIDEYKKLAKRIKKYKIANVKLVNIKPLMVSDFFHNDLEKYSYTVIKKTRFLLNAAFESAIENDFCYKNPVKNAAIPQKAPGEKKTFSDKDVKLIDQFALQDKDFGACMMLLLHAGLRSEELRAIGPADIDNRIVTIDKAIKETGELGDTKNHKVRKVPLPKNIAIFINSALNKSDLYILGGERFVGKDTLRSKYNAFFKRLNKWLLEQEKPAVHRLPPHCCRHTYSTQLQRAGVPMTTVAALLGHSELAVTERYTHLDTIDDLIKAIDRL